MERTEEAEVMGEHSQILVRELEQTIIDLSETNKILAERAALAECVAAISAALSQANGLSEMLQCCCDAMVKHLDAALARIWTFNEKENVLELQASAGISTDIKGGHGRIPVGQNEIGFIALERVPYLTNAVIGDTRVSDQEWAKREGLVAFAGYPLLIADQLVGVVAQFARRTLGQNTFDVMGSLAQSIAVGIRRQLIEAELRQNEERFCSMVENVKDHAIFMLDVEGRVITWNKGAEQVRGYTADEIIGKHYSCFFTAEDREKGMPERLLKLALDEGHSEDEGWRSRKNGSRFWASSAITAVRNRGGGLIGFSAVTRDLTRRITTEEALKRAKEEADAANEAKSNFLAGISHEIRTPMTGIIGMAGLLYDTELTSKQREYCEIIRQSGHCLLTIINEVLDFSKIESGKLELEIIDFDLRNAVEEVTTLFAQQAADKGLELIHFIRYDVPTNLRGDPGRLRQILSNLLGNAVKFTAAGEVVVRVNVVKQTRGHASLRFEVSDTGIGIPENKVDKLFNAFTQADASVSRKYGGTGLGLALCKKFVDLMGGEIGVSSEEGRGSNFWFTIELLKSQETARARPRPRTDLRGLRLLIVDGNSTSRMVFEHYLMSLGITNQSAVDGPSALERLRASREGGAAYDLVIFDMILPGMNGIELARAIRQDAAFDSLKLLLLTSIGKRGDGALARQAGIDGYLTKPVGLTQLFEYLVVLMGKAPKGDASSSIVTRHTLAEFKAQCRLRTLVADDNHINQKVTVSLLENMGHRADVAGNGREALEAYKLVPYDVILMDVQMPEMDGFEASRQIRSIQQQRGRPTAIIAITAHAIDGFKEKCMRAGFDDYVSKPILPQELRAAIERATTRPGSTASSNGPAESGGNDDVIDIADALALVEGDRELFGEIARMFLDQYPSLLAEIDQAFSSSDCKSLTSAAHTLASSAGQVGAGRAVAAARKLEELGRHEDLAGVPAVLAELEAELASVQSALVRERFSFADCE